MSSATLGLDRPLSQWWGTALSIGGLAILYALTGRAGLMLAVSHESATLIWPPTGLSLAALILGGRRLWPGVFIGALAVNALNGTSADLSVAIALGNTGEAVVGAWLVQRMGGFHPGFDRLRDVLGFVLWGGLVCTLISSGVGSSALVVMGDVPTAAWPTIFLHWWLGDALGATVVAPLLLVGVHGEPSWPKLLRRWETWLVLLSIGGLSELSFGGILPDSVQVPMTLLTFPFLVWAGLRLGPRGAVIASALAVGIAVLGTVRGTAPMAGTATSLWFTWAYATTTGVAAIILAAAVAERSAAVRTMLAGEKIRETYRSRLEQAQRFESLGVLAGGVAHDFNNLLGAIMGNASLVAEGETLSDEALGSLNSIEVAAEKASDLCEQLLTFAGKASAGTAPFDVVALVSEMNRLVAASVSKKVRVETDFPEHIPPVHGSATQIRQVVMNLILNANEAIGDRVGIIRVTLRSRQMSETDLGHNYLPESPLPGEYVVVEVADDGCGMDAETQMRVFEPFFTTKFTGRGLGLAATLGIVRSHGGAIQLNSAAGEGSAFRLFLPTTSVPATLQEPATATASSAHGVVLIADDEAGVRDVAARILERSGWRVIIAHDGEEAVRQFREHQREIELVILDVTMPRLGGDEVLAKIRALAPDAPVLMMSGYLETELDITEMASTAFIHKPFRPTELRAKVTALVEATRSEQDAT